MYRNRRRSMRPLARLRLWLAAPLLVVVSLEGCSSFGYYMQAAGGQWSLAAQRRQIAGLIAANDTPPPLRHRLELVQSIRHYAGTALDLDAGDSYRQYVALDRPFVVWNVFATPALAMTPVRWCFPVAGCVDYRGYFHEDDARRFALRLARRGDDTYVGGVPAYSTLGWFDDPVLSTFIWRDDAHLAELMFHELAHRRFYLKGDTPFNESYATAVAAEGVCEWLTASGRRTALARYRLASRTEERFLEWAAGHREALAKLYAEPISDTEKRRRKVAQIDAMQHEFENLLSSEPAFEPYRQWVMNDLNNAKLISARAYHRWVDAFRQLMHGHAGDWPGFYRAVSRLADMPAQARHARLDALNGLWRSAGDGCIMAGGEHAPTP